MPRDIDAAQSPTLGYRVNSAAELDRVQRRAAMVLCGMAIDSAVDAEEVAEVLRMVGIKSPD